MTTYAGTVPPSWFILDRDTGEVLEAVPYGSHRENALMCGDADWLFRTEVAHNKLTGEYVYR